jgi:DNA-binding NarL/FixJ family response regulator
VLDGYEATYQIKDMAKDKDTAPIIIAVTTSVFDEDRHRMIAAGCDDILPSPFKTHALLDMLAKHLDVPYIYESDGDTPSTGVPHMPLTTTMLATLPHEHIQDIHHATLLGDISSLEAIVQQLPPEQHEVADTLTVLIDEFQFDTILAATMPLVTHPPHTHDHDLSSSHDTAHYPQT